MSDTPRTDDVVMQAVAQGMRLAPVAELARELERENAALRDVIEQWKCRYYDVADAICRESNGPQDLCRQAWALRADKQRLDWMDQNMTAGASFETFQKTVPIGETRKAIDEAIRKEAQP